MMAQAAREALGQDFKVALEIDWGTSLTSPSTHLAKDAHNMKGPPLPCTHSARLGRWRLALLAAGMTLILGVRGGPRCPSAVACVAAVVAWLKDGGWGPTPIREAQQRYWHRLRDWVQGGSWSQDDETRVAAQRDAASIASLNH